ncbi:unnamed protein product [Caenorhabditis auriculariae]|uniref:Uncharacterized protein n=1 Tax=Caenorhabditis auriculariae TaxID=2777116 RepID=A0A8S1H8B4_9PELO|nr:unnamed protein product [Caenorhabditis auriculariae]
MTNHYPHIPCASPQLLCVSSALMLSLLTWACPERGASSGRLWRRPALSSSFRSICLLLGFYRNPLLIHLHLPPSACL